MFASILSQVSEPTWVASMIAAGASFLAIPLVSSYVTKVLRSFTDATGLDPRILVFVVASAITALTYWQAPLAWPVFDSANPVEFVAGWSLLFAGMTKLTETLYNRLLREWSIFAPSG